MTDREKICREFHEACGGHWHEWEWDTQKGTSCSVCHATPLTIEDKGNPQYLHPDEVLQVIMEQKDCVEFLAKECKAVVWWQIPIAYIINEGEFQDKLLIAAHKWVMERKVAR